MRGRRATLFALIAASGGCERRPEAAAPRLHEIRSAAKIQYDLGTGEGYRSAAALLAEAARGRPETGDLLNYARASIFADSPAAAREALAEAKRRLAGAATAEVLYLEGLAAKREGDQRAAAARFREVAERAPGDVAVWYQLGAALWAADDLPAAIEAYRKVADLEKGYFGQGALHALQLLHRRAGRNQEADEWMERFRRLQEARAATAPPGNPPQEFYEKNRYTEMAVAPAPRSEAEPPQPRLSYADATAELLAGLARPRNVRAIATLDLEGDGDLDLYLACEGPNVLLRQDASPGAHSAPSTGSALHDLSELSDSADPGSALAAAAGDFNNDGLADLYVVNAGSPAVLFKGLGEGVFQPLPKAGAGGEGTTLAARWADFDHDGDLDLILLAGAGPELRARALRNLGDESFLAAGEGDRKGEPFPGAAGRLPLPSPAASAPAGAFVAQDLDQANDLDAAFPGFEDDAVLYRNQREGPFERTAIAGTKGAGLVLSGDLDDDGDFDLLLAPASSGGPLRIAWSEDPRAPSGPRWRVEDAAAFASLPAAAAAELCDLDNDGDLDLALATAEGLRLALNRKGGRLEAIPAAGGSAGAGGEAAGRPLRHVAAADLNGDGLLDLLLAARSGELAILRAAAEPRYPCRTLVPRGTRDNRAGLGSLVELYAGRAYQARCVEGQNGARFGLGSLSLTGEGSGRIEGLRITWPNGIVQAIPPAELKWDERGRLLAPQKSGLSVSCPFLYGFDGEAMRFLTDVVGIAPLDEWLPEGQEPLLIPEEHVRIPGDRLAARDGRLVLAITEELRETTYLDAVELIEVTGPADRDLYLDESTRRGAPAPLEAFALRKADVRAPAAARGPGGRDALERVRSADRRYLHAYGPAPSQLAGWVEPDALELDIGSEHAAAVLLLTGRIAWPDSDVVFSASQSGRRWPPPRLEALETGSSGQAWRELCSDIGFPSGMDRTLVLPLPAGVSGRLRLVAGHRFLWDRIALGRGAVRVPLAADGPAREGFHRRTLLLLGAVLGYHGRSAVVGDADLHEQTYDYQAASPLYEFARARGMATRYGDVRELLRAADDRLVVLVGGDRVEFEFEAPAALEAGLARTYFLRVAGWAKEGSFHNRTGRWISPLPYRSMGRYPPAGRRPGEDAELTGVEAYQTRWIER